MFTQIYNGSRTAAILGLCIALGACGIGDDTSEGASSETAVEQKFDGTGAPPRTARNDQLLCALNDSDTFRLQCSIERLSNAEGPQMIFRHPDGGFRRFLVLQDGRGLAAADGALTADIAIIADGVVEVTVGSDRYRMPAKIGSAEVQ